MYIIRRLIGFGFLAAIYLICAGAYDAFIQAGTQRTPETITISELQKKVPANRHIIVTGGTPVLSKAVEYCRTRHGVRETNSEIYFIPIQDSALPASASTIPPLLLKMNKEQADKIKNQGGFDSSRIEGVRMTHWDLESKAKDYLVSAFGNSGVERMIILDYRHDVVGVWRGLGQLIGGFVLLGMLALASAKPGEPQRSKQAPPPLHKQVSPQQAQPAISTISAPLRRKPKAIVAIAIATALVVLSCVVLFRNSKQWLTPYLPSQRDDWSDWQLPIRIGDSIETVRNQLGQESYDGNRLMDRYEKAHHLGGYGGDVERQKSAAEGTIALYWQDKGISVYFQNGRATDITVYTADRPDGESDVRMTKYDGSIIAGVTAADRLEDLLRKLGNASEVTDSNPNDKDYLWKRRAFVIVTRIAMEDIVTKGLPFKAHEMEGVLRIEDIAPYLQSERDKQSHAKVIEKEKALVTITGATLPPKEIFQRYSGRVVEIQALNSRRDIVSTGTGFMWKGDEVLTNWHVIEKARSLRIQRGGEAEDAYFASTETAGRLSHLSVNQDWVQLFLWKSHDLPPVTVAADAPDVGESVTVIGNPERLTNSLSTGIVAGIREVEGNKWIQITAPISQGSSGSPVFDSKGQLIGMATMMFVDGQNLNFATPVTQISAGVAVEIKPGLNPFKAIANDKTFEQKKWALLSAGHTSNEIREFAEEFGNKYSDPADKAQIFDAVADAYGALAFYASSDAVAQREFRNAVKIMQQKMQKLGTDLDDYRRIADFLEGAGDTVAMKRELREGITSGIRKFAKEYLPDSRETAAAVAYMFDKLQDREDAARWFDIHLALLLPDIAEWTLPNLPKWYQTERAAREKIETDVDRLTPKDTETYIDSLRQRWRTEVDRDIVALLRSWGLSDEKAKRFLQIGIDSIPAAYWEEQVRPKVREDQWLLLRTKLDERKSL